MNCETRCSSTLPFIHLIESQYLNINSFKFRKLNWHSSFSFHSQVLKILKLFLCQSSLLQTHLPPLLLNTSCQNWKRKCLPNYPYFQQCQLSCLLNVTLQIQLVQLNHFSTKNPVHFLLAIESFVLFLFIQQTHNGLEIYQIFHLAIPSSMLNKHQNTFYPPQKWPKPQESGHFKNYFFLCGSILLTCWGFGVGCLVFC